MLRCVLGFELIILEYVIEPKLCTWDNPDINLGNSPYRAPINLA